MLSLIHEFDFYPEEDNVLRMIVPLRLNRTQLEDDSVVIFVLMFRPSKWKTNKMRMIYRYPGGYCRCGSFYTAILVLVRFYEEYTTVIAKENRAKIVMLVTVFCVEHVFRGGDF